MWGANAHDGEFTHSVLAESEAVLDRSNTLFGRAGFVQKDENVVALSAGYMRELLELRGATIGLGGMATVNLIPPSLEAAYGSTAPLGGAVFLRLRPGVSPSSSR